MGRRLTLEFLKLLEQRQHVVLYLAQVIDQRVEELRDTLQVLDHVLLLENQRRRLLNLNAQIDQLVQLSFSLAEDLCALLLVLLTL